ncbi:histidine phosphatase family protein [Streptomyces sp. NPDC047928]|uniref:histidine phosphatase family protein n=1 Tax=unclassified Streptomyces TaxID=2593676 RepID=UPI00371409BD
MTVRLTLLAAAVGGDAPHEVRVGDDPPLGAAARRRAASVELPPGGRFRTAPERRCRDTAEALGLDAAVDPELRDIDLGGWRGRTLDELAAADPAGLAAWTADPAATPHGGESVAALCARVAAWLDGLPEDTGRLLAVTGPSVVRAALVHALAAPAVSFWRVDVPPLSLATLTGRAGRWNLRL